MASRARAEARALLVMVGSNGDTLETVRDLIAVPPEIEKLLRTYAKFHPVGLPQVRDLPVSALKATERDTAAEVTVKSMYRQAIQDPPARVRSKLGRNGDNYSFPRTFRGASSAFYYPRPARWTNACDAFPASAA